MTDKGEAMGPTRVEVRYSRQGVVLRIERAGAIWLDGLLTPSEARTVATSLLVGADSVEREVGA